MASPFDDIDAAGQAVIENRLGEAVIIIGMIGGDYSSGVDPGRPQQETLAVVAKGQRVNSTLGGVQGRDATGSNRTHTHSEMLMTKERFRALDWPPVRDDIVVIDAGTSDEKRFSISAVLPAEFDDVQFILSEEIEPNE